MRVRFYRILDALRRLIVALVWLLIMVLILVAIGEWSSGLPIPTTSTVRVEAGKPVNWAEVDKALAAAITDARKETEKYTLARMGAWQASLMSRVDEVFLPWFFGYWHQQICGLKSLYYTGMGWVMESPSATEKLTEALQESIAQKILRPEIAALELKNIAGGIANFYSQELEKRSTAVALSFQVPLLQWQEHIKELARISSQVNGNRSIPIPIKAAYAGSAVLAGAGVAALATRLIGGMAVTTSKPALLLTRRLTTKAVEAVAAKTGAKVASKAGGKFLGTIVGIAVLAWDLYDHVETVEENRPILRQNLQDYFQQLTDLIIYDPENGLFVGLSEMERQALSALK
jgi:hypothetical protein